MPKLLRTEEKTETGSGNGEDENGKVTRRPKVTKTYAGVHQSKRQTRNIRGKVFYG